MRQSHPISPIYDSHSKLLILGSFPSVKSRAAGFFYGHPQNRFWKVTSAVFGAAEPETIPEKRKFLLSNGIALWDVIASCEIQGSSDSSIRNVVPNDLGEILSSAPVSRIFTNGATAKRLYDRYIFPETGRPAVLLPSTSPANASWSLDRLKETWRSLLCEP